MIKFVNEANEATIQLFGDIGQSWFSDGWTLEKFTDQLKEVKASNLTIEVKSNGGDVFEAFAIYDAIRQLKARVTVNIVGASASAATIIASAADKITITENSRYLVHNAQTFVEGNKDALKDVYDQLVSIDNQILDIYVKRTGKSKALLADLMSKEKWMTAQEALEWGFVDEIIKQKVTNMKKFENLTPDEQAEFDQLLADKAALQERVDQLEAELSEIRDAQAAAEEQEITQEVEEVVKEDEEMKNQLVAFGKMHKIEALRKVLATMKAVQAVETLADVPKPAAPKDKEQVWEDFKAGKITAAQYQELTK